MINSARKQQGVALLTVLMVLSIMVAIAVAMTGRLTTSLKRTEGLVFSQNVYWYGQAAAEMGVMVLNEDFQDSDVTSLDQTWATPDMTFPLENGNLGGEIKDMRSCFNVNALRGADEDYKRARGVTQFQLLLEKIGVEEYSAEIIADSTRDWIDVDDHVGGEQGAEDSIYQARSIPHLAANNLMANISELRSVQGVGQKTFKAIEPFLCAIPATDQKINVNTVTAKQAEILYALFPKESGIELADFREVLKKRPRSGWSNVDAFLAEPIISRFSVSDELKKQLSVKSEFFQLNGVVEFDERLMALQLLFKLDNKKASVIRYQSGGFK